jgi:hypothetical protein
MHQSFCSKIKLDFSTYYIFLNEHPGSRGAENKKKDNVEYKRAARSEVGPSSDKIYSSDNETRITYS